MTDIEIETADTALAVGAALPLRRWVMAASMLVLNLIDVVLTKAILRAGGVEANPIMAPIITVQTRRKRAISSVQM